MSYQFISYKYNSESYNFIFSNSNYLILMIWVQFQYTQKVSTNKVLKKSELYF